jgi:undecaprenyl-diphosphatase
MISWDLSILHLINREWTHTLLDWLMPSISAVNAWLPLMGLAVLLVLWRNFSVGIRLILCVALALILSDGVISKTLKKTIGRVRPRDAITGVMIRDLGSASPQFLRLFKPPTQQFSAPRGDTKGSSFPSSHAMNMFALATVIALFHRRWGMVMYVIAALVAYSRIYVGAHWPSDIPPSIGMGIFVGWVVTRLIMRKFGTGVIKKAGQIM